MSRRGFMKGSLAGVIGFSLGNPFARASKPFSQPKNSNAPESPMPTEIRAKFKYLMRETRTTEISGYVKGAPTIGLFYADHLKITPNNVNIIADKHLHSFLPGLETLYREHNARRPAQDYSKAV